MFVLIPLKLFIFLNPSATLILFSQYKELFKSYLDIKCFNKMTQGT